MKKLFYTILILLFVVAGHAQGTSWGIWPRNTFNLRVGPEIAFPLRQLNYFQGLGTGVSAMVDLPVAQRVSAVLSAGFMSFGGDVTPWDQSTRFRRATVIPLRAGAYYRLLPSFYGGAQVGYASVSFPASFPDENRGGLSQSIGAYFFNGRFDVGGAWELHHVYGGLNSLNIKASYVLFGRRL